ncbi:hypothetical protein C1645_834801 [Glomus cerebriforme]|uniref:Uncharacterized protein n=1 Tax=Glomus cerebriforme TaxID=658196 RepID=A0A397SJS7_9GLOM|nr:hypothetical protein C1645_834801 [Glomus cerebriforme]
MQISRITDLIESDKTDDGYPRIGTLTVKVEKGNIPIANFDIVKKKWVDKSILEFALPEKPFAEGGMRQSFMVTFLI